MVNLKIQALFLFYAAVFYCIINCNEDLIFMLIDMGPEKFHLNYHLQLG